MTFKNFIRDRIHRKVDLGDLKGVIKNFTWQKTEVPVYMKDLDWFEYVKIIRDLIEPLSKYQSEVVDGRVIGDNFAVFPFESLMTIPGSRTRFSQPFKVKDVRQIDKDAEAWVESLIQEAKDRASRKERPPSKLKLSRKSRSGLIQTNFVPQGLEKYVMDNPFDTKYKYIIKDVHDMLDKIKIVKLVNQHRDNIGYIATVSSRVDTPDKVKDGKAKVRSYTDMFGKIFKVDPNTKYGPLMRTRTVGSHSYETMVSDRKEDEVMSVHEEFAWYDQSKLRAKLMRAIKIWNLDLENFDLVQNLWLLNKYTAWFSLQEYMDYTSKQNFLMWDIIDDKAVYRMLKVSDLTVTTMSGNKMRTAPMGKFAPLHDLALAFKKSGLTYDYFRDWSFNENADFGFSSSVDDNTFFAYTKTGVDIVKMILSNLLDSDKTMYDWRLESGSTLGLFVNNKNIVDNDLSKNFVKSLMSPYGWTSKMKPYRAWGYKIKSQNPRYAVFLNYLFDRFPGMRKIVSEAVEPMPVTEFVDYDELDNDWDPKSKYSKLYYTEIDEQFTAYF